MLWHDALLSYLHFICAFALFGALAAEAFVLRLPITRDAMRLLLALDLGYGIAAVAMVAAGVARVYLGAKGESFYFGELFFWAKMATFVAIGAVSILPTRAFFGWRAALKHNPAFLPDAVEIRQLRTLVRVELILFALLPLFAALMARGMGAAPL